MSYGRIMWLWCPGSNRNTGHKIAYAGAPVLSKHLSLNLSSNALRPAPSSLAFSTCPALPRLTVFGFKAYAIVAY